MKKIIIPLLCLLIACKKKDPAADLPTVPIETEHKIPTGEMIKTSIKGFVNQGDMSFSNYASVYSPTIKQNFFFEKNLISIDSFITDKYSTRFILNYTPNVEKFKTILLTGAEYNYLRVKSFPVNIAGRLRNYQGGIFVGPSNVSLSIPPNAIYQTPNGSSPGFFDANIVTDIEIGYLDPLSPDFALSTPCYSMGDFDNERWFLVSAGIVRVIGGSIDPLNERNEYDFRSAYEGKGVLTVPVPQNLPVNLPDTIPLWQLNKGMWQLIGQGRRVGGSYITDITKMGAYNFAIPIKGVYRKVKLKTNTGTPVINATVRLKFGQTVVSESQTDIYGNAFVFVPAGKTLKIEIIGVGRYTQNPCYQGEVVINSQKEIDVVINEMTTGVFSFNGNANICNGSAIQKGEILLRNNFLGNHSYIIPITNGIFSGAIVEEPDHLYYARTRDFTSGKVGADTAFIPQTQNFSPYIFNNCVLDTLLYLNYSIDGGGIKRLEGSLNSFVTYFNVSSSNNQTNSSAHLDQGNNISFSHYGFGVGTFPNLSTLWINGNFYFSAQAPQRITYDRFDWNSGGIVSGSADLWYIDRLNNNVWRNIKMDFRLRKQ